MKIYMVLVINRDEEVGSPQRIFSRWFGGSGDFNADKQKCMEETKEEVLFFVAAEELNRVIQEIEHFSCLHFGGVGNLPYFTPPYCKKH